MSEEIVRWGKADPEPTFKDRTLTFPRMSINFEWYPKFGFELSDPFLTLHPYESEVWLHSINSYEHDFEDDAEMIAAFHTTMKFDGSISFRVRGTNMKTLRERGEQFARFNFEIYSAEEKGGVEG